MNLKLIAQYVIFFGLAFFLLWYATKDLDMANIWSHVKRSNKLMLALIAVVGVASVALRAMRWQLLIEPLGKKPSFLNTFFSIFIGYGVNFLTPRLGEVARCGILSKYEGISADKLAGTMIAERIFDMICLLIVAMLTLLLEYSQISDYFRNTVLIPLQNKLGGNTLYILIGLAIGGLLCCWFLWRMLAKQQASGKSNKLVQILTNLKDGMSSVFKMEKSGLFLLQTFLIWLGYWGMTYIGFKALPELSHLGIGAGFSVLTLGSLGIIATPGGTGAYHLIVGGLLSSVYKASEEIGATYSMVSWALQNGILLLGAALALLAFPIVNRKPVAKKVNV
ncbi:MAG: hypothetical protein RL660_561 [Bacteroidota bacterium]|jgi:uncharacterized protein (TIRG00374 family)